ncbi:MAG TPA: peptidoglycan DD-metalloendopeptidase family protein [Holophaga sp.]|nr:peptidoglycan DD-metalloendopeptidase family protein [Holophaga sp.]
MIRSRPTRGLVLALLALLARAQPPATQDPAAVKRRLAEVQSRLNQVDHQVKALNKRRKGVLVEMQGISLQADRARVQADEAKLKRDQTEAEVRLISLQKESIQLEIQRLRVELRKQVRWMQALGPWGGLSFFPSLSGFDEYLVNGRYLAYWRNLERRKLDLVKRLQDELAQREKELQVAAQRLAQEEKETAKLQANLKLNEDRLQAFLDNLGQDEARQKDIQADLAEEAIQLERMLSALLSRNRTESFEGTGPFAALRGELPRPVEGTLAQGFGEQIHPKFHTRTVQSGLLIAADPGAQVQAVAEGKVVFADSYQSYGPMVILDHGGGFFTLYTHMSLFTVNKGQVMKPGEPVGTVGETMEGPRLGFEIRHLAQPQDPQKWLKLRYR